MVQLSQRNYVKRLRRVGRLYAANCNGYFNGTITIYAAIVESQK